MTLSEKEIELVCNMADSHWSSKNRNHEDNPEEWELTISLMKKICR